MNIPVKPLSQTASVSGQITPQMVGQLAQAGFASILCFRPDNEGGAAQPTFAAVEAAAKEAGVAARYIPAVPGQFGPSEVALTQAALAELPAPVLGYCASGARATALIEAAARQR